MWVVRYNQEAPLWYWGLKQLPESELEPMLASMRGVLFLDGPDTAPYQAVQDVLYWFPQLPARKLLQVRTTSRELALVRRIGVPTACRSATVNIMHQPCGC